MSEPAQRSADDGLAERCEQRAWEDWLHACPADCAREAGLAWVVVADGLAICCAATSAPVMNRAYAFGLDREATEADVDAALAFFAAHGLPARLQIGPASRPALLPGWLQARGLRVSGKRVQLMRDAAAPMPAVACDLAVDELGVDDAAAFGAVCAQAFGLPAIVAPSAAALVGRAGWHCFAARAGREIVATGALHVQGAVAYMGFAATLPASRGRGVQSALIAARVAAARRAGCRHVIAQTGEDTPAHPNPSLHNMRRLGFAEVHWASLYTAAG